MRDWVENEIQTKSFPLRRIKSGPANTFLRRFEFCVLATVFEFYVSYNNLACCLYFSRVSKSSVTLSVHYP